MISPRRCYRNASSVYRVTKQIGLDTLSLTRVNCNFTLFPIQLRYCVSLQRFIQRSAHFKWTEDTGIFLILFLKHCLFDQSKEYASRWSKARNVSRVRWLECNPPLSTIQGYLIIITGWKVEMTTLKKFSFTTKFFRHIVIVKWFCEYVTICRFCLLYTSRCV